MKVFGRYYWWFVLVYAIFLMVYGAVGMIIGTGNPAECGIMFVGYFLTWYCIWKILVRRPKADSVKQVL